MGMWVLQAGPPGVEMQLNIFLRDNMCHLDSLEGNQDAGAESPSQSEEFK